MDIAGKYNTAHVYVKDDELDEATYVQILKFVNHPAFERSQNGEIAIMPDCHAGKGSCVGYTSPLGKYVVPDTIGVDIGCGVLATCYGKCASVDCADFDTKLRQDVPIGFAARPEVARLARDSEFDEIFSRVYVNDGMKASHARCSCGSMGGGNHFIELDYDEDHNLWSVIHTGSRNLGVAVWQYHTTKFKAAMTETGPRNIAYAEIGSDEGKAYLADMRIAQHFAYLNRRVISQCITRLLNIRPTQVVESIHNYIDLDQGYVRKGAISAMSGEPVVIPLNSAFGTVIGTGIGNKAWNYSAPHGAGRRMSRSQAKKKLCLAEYSFTLASNGVYTTSANLATLDEAPLAYKPAQDIIKMLEPSVRIDRILKPIYNLKAGED